MVDLSSIDNDVRGKERRRSNLGKLIQMNQLDATMIY